jgi:predicted  nucleic acid-binding Zn-ribbon protein
MSLVQDLYAGLKRIVTIEDRIVQVADNVKRLQLDVAGHGERLARLEGKFELLEATAPTRRRKLPE